MRAMKGWMQLPLAALAVTTLLLAGCDDKDDPPAQPQATAKQSGSNNPVVLGLTDEGELVAFRANAPGTIAGRLALSGQVVDNPSNPPIAVSADYRPSTGVLYVLFNDDRLYAVNLDNGALSLVAQIAFPASATVESVDFNPVADLIRALSSGPDQGNFRVNPSDGSVRQPVDTVMSYQSGDPNAGDTPSIDGVAYTGFSNATATTAYVLDTNQDVLATLGSTNGSPNTPNSGLLETVGDLNNPIGGGSGVGFDIPTADATVGFVSDAGDGETRFFRINLSNGALTLVGTVPGERLLDITLVPGTGLGENPNPAPNPTPNPSPNPTPTPGGVGLTPGDGLCDLALAGPGFTTTLGEASDACADCSISDEANLLDADFENFAVANLTGISLVGPAVGDISVTVTAPAGATFVPNATDGTPVGLVLSAEGGAPGELALLPGVNITTLLAGEEVLDDAGEPQGGFTGPLLLADLMGAGIGLEEKFTATINATKPFDAIRFTFDAGLVGVNSTYNLFYGCAKAPAEGGFAELPF